MSVFIPLFCIVSVYLTKFVLCAIFGAIAFAEIACSTIGSSFGSFIYAATVPLLTGFVFFVEALFYLIGCMLIIYYIIREKREDSRKKYMYEHIIPVDGEE
ncbi:hypothetical protein CAPTEDRAFT_191195 [Capitella teleta]|uniref:Uncharacterized protein n=1 Tax=Capitella teleta TaxID=283909 RepID=R7UAE1_CAPTE|nr:hypothetical protein CAPTEDRAFT_191195 [Capitella teleta]|eukprot:ELU02914.1 hypothetical protein CAPTEDRAFT_191195 [Capitella teleta]